MKYKHVFFDLDGTLWDFETNSKHTLSELIPKHGLLERGIPSVKAFIEIYQPINIALWDDYQKGKIEKATLRIKRFSDTFLHFGVKDQNLLHALSEDYVKESPHKKALFPFAFETLDYLQKKYDLHIITNGFEEVQHIKMHQSGLTKYFREVITSERAGFKKPNLKMFEYALQVSKAKKEESIMIGDHFELDILGAKGMGMDQCYFNPLGKAITEEVTHDIRSLKELMSIL